MRRRACDLCNGTEVFVPLGKARSVPLPCPRCRGRTTTGAVAPPRSRHPEHNAHLDRVPPGPPFGGDRTGMHGTAPGRGFPSWGPGF